MQWSSTNVFVLGWNRPRRLKGLCQRRGPGPSILRKFTAAEASRSYRSRPPYRPLASTLEHYLPTTYCGRLFFTETLKDRKLTDMRRRICEERGAEVGTGMQ